MNQYPTCTPSDPSKLTRKDFVSDQEVKWCPGCVDYSILAQVQKLLPTLGIPKENFVFVSGIGCSSRFPYYMNTYGMHSIHGRAPAIATGIKVARPELSVWMVTGDGDALAIGGNHFIHAIRRNVGIKILLFNNRIYGLTKGQYSPTSEFGKKTKSTPYGSVDYPLEPTSIAIGAGATFVARALGNDGAGLGEVLRRAAMHDGTAVVEIYQNCVIFNDGAFDTLAEAAHREMRQLHLEHGKPLRFGPNGSLGIGIDKSGRPVVREIATSGEDNVLVHDEQSESLSFLLSRLTPPDFPTPLGVFRDVKRDTYEHLVVDQIEAVAKRKSVGVQALLDSGETWTVG